MLRLCSQSLRMSRTMPKQVNAASGFLVNKSQLCMQSKRLQSTIDSNVIQRVSDFEALQSPPVDLASLGLCNATPSGALQSVMETIHNQGNLPWWACIICTTVTLRLLIFPFFIHSRRNAVKQNNMMPEVQRSQMLVLQAKKSGDVDQLREAEKTMMSTMRQMYPLMISTHVPMIFSATAFTSMFFALRGMINAPVSAMGIEGLLWFPDLTSPDPFMLLPLLTVSSLLLHLKVGGDGVDINSQPVFVRRLLYGVAIVSVPFMCQFGAGLNLYWFTSNLFTIAQAQIVSREAVRSALKIDKMIKWKPEDLPMNQMMNMGGMANFDKEERKDNTGSLEEVRRFTQKVEEEIKKEVESKKK